MPARPLKVNGPDSRKQVSERNLRTVVAFLREAGERGASKAELLEVLEATSLKTVDRAVKVLEADGAQFVRTFLQLPGADGPQRMLRLTLVRGPRWDESITSHARVALQVLVSALRGGAAAAWCEHLDQLQALAEAHLTERDRRIFESLRDKVVVHGGPGGARSGAKALMTLLEALGGDGRRSLELRYATAHAGREEDLRVVPWRMVHDLFSGGAFLLAWDLDKGRPTHLRLERILAARQGGSHALLPGERAQLDRAAAFQIGGWIGAGEPVEILVRVRGRNWVQALLDSPPPLPQVEVQPEGSDAARVRFHATEFKAPARWVLQMGPDAEALGPEEFRTFVGQRVAEAARRYRA